MISGNVYKGLDGKAITDLVPGVEYFIDKTVGSNQVRLQRITGSLGNANYANVLTGVRALLGFEGTVADANGVSYGQRAVVETIGAVTAVTVDGGDDTVDLTVTDNAFADGDVIYLTGGTWAFDVDGVTVDGETGAVTVSAPGHDFVDGDTVVLASVGGATDANGTWVIENVDTDVFDLVGADGSEWEEYTSGGTATGPANTLNGQRYTVGTVDGDDLDLNDDADQALDGSAYGTYDDGMTAHRVTEGAVWGVFRTAAGAVRLGVTGLGLVDGTYDLVLMYTR